MNRRTVSPFLLLLLTTLTAADDTKLSFFRDKVQPILSRCVGCHSGDDPSGGLDLTVRDRALKGGESGAAVRPGKSTDSLLYRMVETKAMPPKKPLLPEQIADLRRWIDEGAAWEGKIERVGKAEPARAGPDWWSLQNPRRPEVPAVKNRDWPRTPLDVFVLARLEARGLSPAPPADRATLLRRATFDLTGLPPTPEEIDAFVHDPSPLAWEKVVDRLLASPHYGERWGRHWLDTTRFCESQGFERDKPRDHAWRYRDYVLRALNEDRPYSQFVREQVAGDVLPGSNAETIAATGFLVAGPWDEVGASQQGAVMKQRAREDELEDMVSAVGQVFLGLTVQCARCHLHKFDPIEQADYYRLKAALEGVRHGDRPLTTAVEQREHEAKQRALGEEIARLESRLSALEAAGRKKVQGPSTPRDALPAPVARWTFEGDARDSLGQMHATLHGGAKVEGGRLKLDGKGAYARTATLGKELKAKTLEVWVTLANREQRGGGVMTVQDKPGKVFDAIVFAERQPRRWIAGSDFFRRSRDLGGPEENGAAGAPVHLLITWSEKGEIALYRNGEPYGKPYTPEGENAKSPTFLAGDGHVLFGLRHTGAGNGFLAGEIEDARLYDRVLTGPEVAASFRAGPQSIPLEAALAALTAEERKEHARLSLKVAEKREQRKRLSNPGLAYAANPAAPPPTHVLIRGDVEKQGERVAASGLSVLPGRDWGLAVDAPEADRRIKLADWLASSDNPLTARVIVNRLWHFHFGRGIVASPSDFGFNGERPTHPELLDWLAVELQERGGSLKAMHRLILLSSTYRQSSRPDERASAVDAECRLLWRFPPRRLEGEVVRDAMLSASGRLNREMCGPSFRPFKIQVFNSTFYIPDERDIPEHNRRAVYRMNVNSARSKLLEALDCPDPSVKTPRRATTTTPLHALALMNNPFVLAQSRHFAERLRQEVATDEGRIARAWLLALGREPRPDEREKASKVVREHDLDTLCWILLNTSEVLYLR